MSNSVNSVNPNMKFTPNLNKVVVPPAKIYKYSMYDELHLGEDKYKEIISALKEPSPGNKKAKKQKTVARIFKTLALIGIGIIGYKNRARIMEQLKKIPQITGKK